MSLITMCSQICPLNYSGSPSEHDMNYIETNDHTLLAQTKNIAIQTYTEPLQLSRSSISQLFLPPNNSRLDCVDELKACTDVSIKSASISYIPKFMTSTDLVYASMPLIDISPAMLSHVSTNTIDDGGNFGMHCADAKVKVKNVAAEPDRNRNFGQIVSILRIKGHLHMDQDGVTISNSQDVAIISLGFKKCKFKYDIIYDASASQSDVFRTLTDVIDLTVSGSNQIFWFFGQWVIRKKMAFSYVHCID